jgi:Cu(I)/Ag(I) efflux system membrane fusion protein
MFDGTIRFIDPVIDPVNRVAKVRVEIGNPGGKLKPEMFATGIVRSNLTEYKGKLVIPASAILWTGKRSIVYVKQAGDEPIFNLREVELGPKLGESFVVLAGLNDGEEIATQGAFSIDAAAQLEGKPSMMNQPSASDGLASNEALTKIEFKVSGNCDMCKERIETTAKAVAGVISAEWNVDNKLLQVKFDASKTNSDGIQKAIAQAGHDTEKYKAPDQIYKALPECCLYRK